MKHQNIVLVIYLSSFFTAGVFLYSLKIAPIFTSILLTALAVVLVFLSTESWTIHSAAEFENRFWTLLTFFLGISLFFVSDSPLVVLTNNKIPYEISWLAVLLITFIIHNYDRHRHRVSLTKKSNIKKAPHSESSRTDVAQIMKLMMSIDNPWISSAISNIFLLPRILYFENQIIKIFKNATPIQLNQIISNIELGLILYKIKDHRLARQLNRTELLNLLIIERLNQLTIPSKAIILDALQRLNISAHSNSEEYAKIIIKSTKEDDLSELKTLTDSKGNFNSMHRLVYIDIRTSAIREDILKHISREAKVQNSHNIISSKKGKRRKQFAWRKILSDIDDTLSCSFGPSLAGIDRSYPPKVVYPGVLAFYRELDVGTTGADEWEPDRVGNLVFLSARPHLYKDVSENISFAKFKSLKENYGMHTTPSLLAGSLDTGTQFLFGGLMDPLAVKKFENFKEYLSLYPEFKCIFIGDNGQGDVRVAEMVLDQPEYRDNLERIYIHEVQPLSKMFTKNEITKTRCAPRTCYFLSYVDAAIDAFRHNLIRCTGLRRVCLEAIKDFEAIPKRLWNLSEAKEKGQREARLSELNSALRRANLTLIRNGLIPVPLIKFAQIFPTNSPVSTMYGMGIVTKFRSSDGISEVIIPVPDSIEIYHRKVVSRVNLKDVSIVRHLNNNMSFHTCYFPNNSLSKCANYKETLKHKFIFSIHSNSKNLKLMREQRALETSFTVKNLDPLNYSSKKPEDIIGALVWTPYGVARIVSYRKSDNIYSAALNWGAIIHTVASNFIRISDIPTSSPSNST